MDFEIIDFHTHPYAQSKNNICAHKDVCKMDVDTTYYEFKKLGVSTICGSVVELCKCEKEKLWKKIKANNDEALMLRDYYKGFYIPGFHIHPEFIEESINEIHRMHSLGVNLIGELVPYIDGWSDYSCEGFSYLLEEAAKYNMIVNFHSGGENQMDEMVKKHKDVIFVAAHPGEYSEFMRHIERAKLSENYYLDLSGYGMFRYGMLRKAIDTIGIDRIVFGSDYPTCNPGMYIGGVLFDNTLTDTEKEKIFSVNAKKLLNKERKN